MTIAKFAQADLLQRLSHTRLDQGGLKPVILRAEGDLIVDAFARTGNLRERILKEHADSL